MNDSQRSTDAYQIDESDVVQYLSRNPDFFLSNPRLVKQLELYHEEKRGNSLSARQLSSLRTETAQLRERLTTVLKNSSANEKTFGRIRALCLALLDCNELSAVNEALESNLKSAFALDDCVLYVKHAEMPQALGCISSDDRYEPSLQRVATTMKTVCETVRAQEYNSIFGEDGIKEPGSIAMIPAHSSDTPAVLLLGSADPERYAQTQGTLFIEFVGNVLGRVLSRIER